MTEKDTGGPAFPYEEFEHGFHQDTVVKHPGMTLRDWFAGQAMAALITKSACRSAAATAATAYEYADAMLAERNK